MQSFLNVIQPRKVAPLKGAIRTFANLKKANVCIIGSGPAGSLFARRMVEDGRSTIVLEAGTQKSEQPGEHLKNAYIYQRELSTFSNIISGTLQPASIPPSDPITLTDNPGVWSLPLADVEAGKGFIKNGQNPNQIPNMNLSGWGNTYGVGGMATHWTCSTPRQHPTMERYNSEVYNDKEWDRLYSMNEQLLHTTHDLTHIQGKPTLRHTLVEETIAKRFNSQLESGRHVNSLPLAATRTSDKIIHWSAPYDILKPVLGNPNFHLVKNTLARELVMEGGRIKSVKVKNLMTGEKYQIEADVFVVACNSILTPQLLWASRIRPKALGRYLCEQPMTFCQVALRQDLVDKYINDPRFKGECDQYHEKNPHDPLTIPINAPDPQVWIPVTKDRPWHAQIHRDAFSYGEVIPSVDTRLIVDLRYFGMTQPHVDRRVTFSDKVKDIMGMPQPTFHWFYDNKERKECFQMMEEMMVAANAIGGFLDGREPKFMAPGLALHVTGTVRMGKNTEDSVVDETSRVHGIDNLYLGSNGVIPTPNACNPTLTNLCFVQKASETIVKKH